MWSVLFIYLGTLTLISQGQACSLTLQANTLEQTQASQEGSGTCIWTINVNNPIGDDQRLSIYFRDVLLAVPDTCDTSTGITVFDGDTSGRILGIVCGISDNNILDFFSSATTLTLTYPSDLVNATQTFSVMYTKGSGCLASVTGVEGVEYSLVSPGYPTGISRAKNCNWYVHPPSDEKRVYITLESPTGASCEDVSVKVKKNGLEEEDEWCPGRRGVFQSWEKAIFLEVSLDVNQALLVKYTGVEESTCKGTLNGTNEIQYLTTPNYPQPFPGYTECRWTIENTLPRNGSMRIEVEDMDIETSDGCVTDVLIVQNDLRYENVIGETCSGLASYYTYDYRTLVIFKSWRAPNSHKGIRMKYYHGEAENCTGLLTATSSEQIIESPGYPDLYPNSARCVWRINMTDPRNYIRLEVLAMDIWEVLGSCSDDVLQIYDGTNRIQELCGNRKMTVVGTEESMILRFSSDSAYNARGFRLSYREVDAASPSSIHLASKLGYMTLTSPRYPDGLVKNLDMTWTISSKYDDASIMLRFTDVDIGYPDDCSNNHIKVFYGNTSSSRSTTICGTDTEVFMNPDLTVVLTTGDIPRKRGFQAEFKNMYTTNSAGCDGTLGIVHTYSISTDEFKTLNYPSKYPNMMDCTYVVKAVLDSYKMKFNLMDVDMGGSEDPDCQRDYVEIFDGNSTSAKLFGRFCSNNTQTFESSGHLLLIRVVSDSQGAGRGAKIGFTAFGVYDTNIGTPYLWLIILGSIFGVIVLACLAAFVYYKLRKTGSGAI